MASTINAKNTSTGVVITPDSSGQLELQTADTTRMTIDVNGNVGIGTSSPSGKLHIKTSGTNAGQIQVTADLGTNNNRALVLRAPSSDSASEPFTWSTGNSYAWAVDDVEIMRIAFDGEVRLGNTSQASISSSTATGVWINAAGGAANGVIATYRDSGTVMYVGRQGNDGVLVDFRQAGVSEGSINVSGTTVSYNGGHLSRWSQLYNETTQVEVYRGTVLESVDAMCEWYDDEGNLRPNEQATKTIVSTTPASKAVAGVFDMYDLDDEDNPYDFYVAQSGDFVIRVAAGTVVQNGDLLESAGDGTARVQADDICRSSTIAKVTSNYVSETYADGSFCVPCILMIG